MKKYSAFAKKGAFKHPEGKKLCSKVVMNSKRAAIVFTFLLISGLSAFGQERLDEKQKIVREYEAFRRMFEEQRDDRETKAEDPLFMTVIHAEKLPDWTVSPPKSSRDTLYILGISDPGLEKEAGKTMAMKRALQLWLLLNSPGVDNMRENYRISVNDELMQVYTEFSKVTGETTLHIQDIARLKTHVTAFDETIILAGIPTAKAHNEAVLAAQSKTEVSLFTRLNTIDRREHIVENFHLVFDSSAKASPSQLDQRILRNGAFTENTTHADDSLVTDLPTLNLRYRDAGQNDKNADDNMVKQGLCLRNGLWIALVSGVVQHLAAACHEENSIHFRHMGETYDHISQALGREVTGCNLRFPVPTIDIRNNELFLLFDEAAE